MRVVSQDGRLDYPYDKSVIFLNPKFNKHTEREVVIWQDRRRKQKIKPSDRA